MKVVRFGFCAREFEGFSSGSGSGSTKNPYRSGSARFGSEQLRGLDIDKYIHTIYI